MPETTTTRPVRDHRTQEERAIAERFPGDIANHHLTVLRDDGLYRHLRCAQLGNSFYWFEIVTWPGSLAFRGDMDCAPVFSRVPDMFQFFRGKGYGTINPGYWSEKLPDCGRSVKVHSKQVVRDRLDETLADYEQCFPALAASRERVVPLPGDAGRAPVLSPLMAPDEVRQLIADHEADDRLRFADGARELLADLERADIVSDTWEWDLTDWDWPFLWACHAIVWVIDQYDKARAEGSDA